MQGKWRDSQPSHFFSAAHLKIVYDAGEETASGFIVYETVKGEPRKYPYEAFFRDGRWRVAFTTGDPSNVNPFSNRDRDPDRFRELKGLPRFSRPDLARDLVVKLGRFRDAVLRAETALREEKGGARFVQTGASGDAYWLIGPRLIRVFAGSRREALVALDLDDAGLDNVSRYVV